MRAGDSPGPGAKRSGAETRSRRIVTPTASTISSTAGTITGSGFIADADAVLAHHPPPVRGGSSGTESQEPGGRCQLCCGHEADARLGQGDRGERGKDIVSDAAQGVLAACLRVTGVVGGGQPGRCVHG